MMFSDVDLLFTNSLSDDLNQNSVTSVIFIANVPQFTAQGSKFIFDFGSNCATRCKFLSALPKF